jgi:hypothetical protein
MGKDSARRLTRRLTQVVERRVVHGHQNGERISIAFNARVERR